MGKTVRALVAAAAIALFFAAVAGAQVVIRATAGAKVSVDVSDLRAGGGMAMLAKSVLTADLERSGWIRLAGADVASYRLAGQIAEGGGQVVLSLQARDVAGNAVFARSYQVQPQPVAVVRAAHQAADEFIWAVAKKKTFLQAKLACLKRDGTMKTVQVGDSAMRVMQPIRQPSAQPRQETCVRPRWSYDNQRITFTSFLRRFPDVYAYELATGRIAPLAQYPGMNTGGAISPDGRSMAVILSKDGNPDLYVKDLSSGQLRRLTNTRGVTEGSPSWSPDGSQIVYVADGSRSPQLYVISKNGGSPTQLTSGGHNASPDWGPGGLIAYQSQRGGSFQIAVIDPRTRQERLLTKFDASYEDPSWAPDGRHIAATRIVNYRTDIYLLDTEGDSPVALTADGTWSSPAWSH